MPGKHWIVLAECYKLPMWGLMDWDVLWRTDKRQWDLVYRRFRDQSTGRCLKSRPKPDIPCFREDVGQALEAGALKFGMLVFTDAFEAAPRIFASES